MNLSKHLDFFDPLTMLKGSIHIIGCGAIGSTVAEMLTRMGIVELHLWDFDIVSTHNLTNQNFRHKDIGTPKVDALTDILTDINPNLKIIKYPKGYTDEPLSGYVFLCVDNIDLRREICKAQQYNPHVRAIFDFRMRLTDAQHYAADWSDKKQIENLLKTMAFTHEEAKEATPVNACGTTLNIIPTVRVIVSYGLANFINFVKTGEIKTIILADAFHYILDAFSLKD